eukprot:4003793-Pyramimonas_sp.AAC.1
MLCSKGLLPDPTFTRHACASIKEVTLILILPFTSYRSGTAPPHSHNGGKETNGPKSALGLPDHCNHNQGNLRR